MIMTSLLIQMRYNKNYNSYDYNVTLLIEKQNEAHSHNEHPYYQEDWDDVLVVLIEFVRSG